ncbi:ABC transporter permease [Paenibacillus sp. NPDC057886]|uniref:ABC transporter permease n=1 Tax=Paenibacillus sp. NPDC057886 TaxID=3346270 RepID=UPI0036CA6158
MSSVRWSVLWRKEWLEARRSYKLLWFPVVFILMGMLQPLSTYYLPQILQMAGGLPDGSHITLPEYTGAEVMASTLANQFDQLGVIIMVIGMMGVIVSDKHNGMLAFVLTRNTTLTEYFLSKWLSQAVLIAVAIGAGFITSLVYTSYLYEGLPLSRMAAGFGIYFVWCLFVVTLTLMLCSILNRSSGVAVVAIFALLFLKGITAFKTEYQILNPAYMSQHAVNMITTGEVLPFFAISFIGTIGIIVVFIYCSTFYLSRKELPSM